MTEREKLMCEVNKAHFTVVELGLFLDTHPHNKKALEMMKTYTEKHKELKKRYEEKFGMIDICSPNNSNDKWTWIENLWPREN